MDLGTAFTYAVARKPGAEAIVQDAHRLTYDAWYGEIRAVAGGLREMGLRRGDHLMVVMRNRHEMATLYWAVQMIGLIYTPVSWRGSQDEIGYCIEDCEAAAIAYDGAAGDAVPAAAAERGFDEKRMIVAADGKGPGIAFERLRDGAAVGGPEGSDPEAIALMLYTSGTTGRPKGVPRSHRAELMASVTQIGHHHYEFGERVLGVMPLFHTMGIRVLGAAMLTTGKFVCMPAYSAEGVMRAAQDEALTSLYLVPTMYHDIVEDSRCAAYDSEALKRIGYAGMSMTTSLTAACIERFRPQSFINHYGSSEIYTFSICEDLQRKPNCAGRPGINQSLRVVAPDAESGSDVDAILAPGETGEIVASMASPEAFSGYWKRPDGDAKALQRGWYRTGDLGVIDDEGDLFVVGRVDDMIVSAGENIYPEEVEDALTRSGLVVTAAVIGVPDERLGARVVAFVEPRDHDVTPEKLEQACLDSGLARFKRPREFVLVKSVPRSASGKLLRRKLKAGEYERIG